MLPRTYFIQIFNTSSAEPIVQVWQIIVERAPGKVTVLSFQVHRRRYNDRVTDVVRSREIHEIIDQGRAIDLVDLAKVAVREVIDQLGPMLLVVIYTVEACRTCKTKKKHTFQSRTE